MKSKPSIVVTGAGGFLGGRTAKFLATKFLNHQIIATSRRNDRSEEMIENNCLYMCGDLCYFDFCDALTSTAEIVVHCAALSAPFGNYDMFYNSNVLATKTLLDACKKNGVKKFIFISTPSIYFNYKNRFNVSEDEVLPKKMVNCYAETKLIAEKHVLENNGIGIKTIALRPRAIIGAEDTVIFPRLLEAYYKGKLRVVGNGNNICDLTCVRNVIESIICCIYAPSEAYGKAYNITDGQSINFWKTLNFVLKTLNLNPPNQKVNKNVAMFFASILEFKAKLFRDKNEPPLTRYSVGVLANSFTLDISKAKDMIHYKPVMKTYEGISEYITWHKKQNLV